MKKPGYREMLRDRCPKMVDYALKWQKAKDKWIDHAYCYFVKMVGEECNGEGKVLRKASESKKVIVRQLLGIVKGKTKNFDFDRSIDWDNLTDEDTVYWKRVSSWVRWFRTTYAYIENAYKISKSVGKSEYDIKIEIINSYLIDLMPSDKCSEEEKQAKYRYVDNFVNFLMRCLKNEM